MSGPFVKPQTLRKPFGSSRPAGPLVIVKPATRPPSPRPTVDTASLLQVRPPVPRGALVLGNSIGAGGFSVVFSAVVAEPCGLEGDLAFKECKKGLATGEAWFVACGPRHANINPAEFVVETAADGSQASLCGLVLRRCEMTVKQATALLGSPSHEPTGCFPSSPADKTTEVQPAHPRFRTHIGFEPPPFQVTRAIVSQLVAGVAAMHKPCAVPVARNKASPPSCGGFVHNDLKMDNMLISEDGTIQICDFGLITLIHTQGCTMPSESCAACVVPTNERPYCTAAYQPPEGWGVPSADVWCLGLAALELATGISPFVDHRRALNDFEHPDPVGWESMVAHLQVLEIPVDALLADFCAACLAVNPAMRPNARELLGHAFCNESEETNKNLVRQWMPAWRASEPLWPAATVSHVPAATMAEIGGQKGI